MNNTNETLEGYVIGFDSTHHADGLNIELADELLVEALNEIDGLEVLGTLSAPGSSDYNFETAALGRRDITASLGETYTEITANILALESVWS